MKTLILLEPKLLETFCNWQATGKALRFLEVALVYMREYLEKKFGDEDRASDAAIRCWERNQVILDKVREIPENRIVGFLKRFATNQYYNVAKMDRSRKKRQEFVHKMEINLTTLCEDYKSTTFARQEAGKIVLFPKLPKTSFLGPEENSNPPEGKGSDPEEILKSEDRRKVLSFSSRNCYRGLESVLEFFEEPEKFIFALKYDIRLKPEEEARLEKILEDRGISWINFQKEHLRKRSEMEARKEKIVSRMNAITYSIMNSDNTEKIRKLQRMKQAKLASLNFLLSRGLYSYSELLQYFSLKSFNSFRIIRSKKNRAKFAIFSEPFRKIA
jgi:hypothetical protein